MAERWYCKGCERVPTTPVDWLNGRYVHAAVDRDGKRIFPPRECGPVERSTSAPALASELDRFDIENLTVHRANLAPVYRCTVCDWTGPESETNEVGDERRHMTTVEVMGSDNMDLSEWDEECGPVVPVEQPPADDKIDVAADWFRASWTATVEKKCPGIGKGTVVALDGAIKAGDALVQRVTELETEANALTELWQEWADKAEAAEQERDNHRRKASDARIESKHLKAALEAVVGRANYFLLQHVADYALRREYADELANIEAAQKGVL